MSLLRSSITHFLVEKPAVKREKLARSASLYALFRGLQGLAGACVWNAQVSGAKAAPAHAICWKAATAATVPWGLPARRRGPDSARRRGASCARAGPAG